MKNFNSLRNRLAGVAGIILICSCQNAREKSNIADKKEQDKKIQYPAYHPTNQALYDTIMALDEQFWEAYNNGDIDVIENMLSEDHEFYHDRGGVTKTKEKNVEGFREFFKERAPMTGATLDNHSEVYEIPGFGALQVGYQQFFNYRNPEGSPPSRVITLWKETENGWKQEYVFSMHPHPADGVAVEIRNKKTKEVIPLKPDSKYDLFNDFLKAEPYDTSNVASTYYLLLHSPGNVTDTFLSTGRLHRSNNSETWVKTQENLIDKYKE